MSRYFTTLHTVRDLPACYVCTSTVGQEVEEVMYTVHVHLYDCTGARVSPNLQAILWAKYR